MHATFDIPDRLGAHALDAALEGLVEVGVAELTSPAVGGGEWPTLYTSGVRYQRERDTEDWLPPSSVMAAGWGDCEDLASWRTAELRVSGEDPTARAIVIRSGPRTWHAVVERENGAYIEDPSAVLGMGDEDEGTLVGWNVRCQRSPQGGFMCTLTRDGTGVVGIGPTPSVAIKRATTAGVGQIPGLDLIANIARAALDAAMPKTTTTPQGTTTTTPPTGLQLPIQLPPGLSTALPSGDVTSDVQRIAREITQITSREARRKLQAAQQAVRGSEVGRRGHRRSRR